MPKALNHVVEGTAVHGQQGHEELIERPINARNVHRGAVCAAAAVLIHTRTRVTDIVSLVKLKTGGGGGGGEP